MVAELLCDPPGAAGAAVGIQSHGHGTPEVADARFVAGLQRRREQGVGLEDI
jgi:hypothetical protein